MSALVSQPVGQSKAARGDWEGRDDISVSQALAPPEKWWGNVVWSNPVKASQTVATNRRDPHKCAKSVVVVALLHFSALFWMSSNQTKSNQIKPAEMAEV
jgi:hypothetical protein